MQVPVSWSTSWTDFDESDMEFARKGVCLGLFLPMPLSMVNSTQNVPLQLLNYAHVVGVLLRETVHQNDLIAHGRVEADQLLPIDQWIWAGQRKPE